MIEALRQSTSYLFVYVGMPLAWLSLVLHLRTPWRRTELGRHLVAYAAVIATIMSFAAVRYWWFRRSMFPDWLAVCQFGVYVALVGVMAWRVALQLRARKERLSGKVL